MSCHRLRVGLIGAALFLALQGVCFARDLAVTVQANVDAKTGTVTLRLTNVSGKDISAFNISVLANYSSGVQKTGETMVDLLPRIISSAESIAGSGPTRDTGFLAGESRQEKTSFPPSLEDGSQLVSVAAKVDVALFTDNTVIVENEAALERILDFRKSTVIATEEAVKVIQRHIGSSKQSSHAARDAALELRQLSLAKGFSSLVNMQLSMIADDLERIAANASGESLATLQDYILKRQRRAVRSGASLNIERKQ